MNEQKINPINVFRFHLYVFIVVNLLLIAINFMFSPFFYWFIFPLFGWLIGITLHGVAQYSTGIFPAKKSIYLHFSLYATTNLLLSIIDFMFSGAITWALYPLVFWGTGLILHAIVYQEFFSEKKTIKKEGTMKKKASRHIFLDKVRALQKKSGLLSASKEKNIIDVEKHPKIIKSPKIKEKTKDKEIIDSEEERKELERTESEVDVEEKEAICVVHKGAIVGSAYICPKCRTYYCLKCANALVEKGEKCWTCESDITP